MKAVEICKKNCPWGASLTYKLYKSTPIPAWVGGVGLDMHNRCINDKALGVKFITDQNLTWKSATC